MNETYYTICDMEKIDPNNVFITVGTPSVDRLKIISSSLFILSQDPVIASFNNLIIRYCQLISNKMC